MAMATILLIAVAVSSHASGAGDHTSSTKRPRSPWPEHSAHTTGTATDRTTAVDVVVAAARSGDVEGLRTALATRGVDVNAHGTGGVTVLMGAAVGGKVEVVRSLLNIARGKDGDGGHPQDDNGIDGGVSTPLSHSQGATGGAGTNAVPRLALEARCDLGNTALLWAARYGHRAVVGELIAAGADVDAVDNEGWTALATVAHEGHLDIARALLAAGAHTEVRETMGGYTALMWAAEEGHAEMIETLVAHGADVNATNNRKGTALMWAAFEGKPAAVRALIAVDADPNARDVSGFTALIIAAGRGDVECTRAMLSSPTVDIDAHDARGVSALLGAVMSGHTDVVRVLAAAGADTELLDDNGLTALMWAAQKGNVEIVRALLRAGATPDTRGSSGQTALMVAAQMDRPDDDSADEIVATIADAGADVNAADDSGLTALMSAAHFGNSAALRELVSRRARCYTRGPQGASALDMARDQGRTKLVEWLRAHCSAEDEL